MVAGAGEFGGVQTDGGFFVAERVGGRDVGMVVGHGGEIIGALNGGQ